MRNSVKTIALVDPFGAGHHTTYLKIYSATLLDMGFNVMAFGSDPDGLGSYISLRNPEKAKQFQAYRIREPQQGFLCIQRLQPVLMAFSRWRTAALTIKTATQNSGNKPDMVFFAWLDSYLEPFLSHYIVDRIFPYPWSGLYFHPAHLRLNCRLSGPGSRDFLLKSPYCRSVAVLDEGIAHRLSKINKKPVVIFPDVADESPPDPEYYIARQITERSGGRKVIGLLGSLEKRKGLLRMLEISQTEAGKKWFFVFAGNLEEQTFTDNENDRIKQIAGSNSPNCLFHFERIPDEPQFNALVAQCDVLYAIYDNFYHSSNILTKAALFDKPVIVNSAHCMGERVLNHSTGVCVQKGDMDECIGALKGLLEGPDVNIKQGFDGYRRLHSHHRLHKAFEELLAY